MKMLGNAAFFFCLPFVLFVAVGYAFAFPWHALAIILMLIIVLLAYVVVCGARIWSDLDEAERLADEKALAAELHKAMSPGFDGAYSVTPKGSVTIKRSTKPKVPAKTPAAWSASVRNSPFFRG